MNANRTGKTYRRGAITVEVLLLLPVVFTVLLAVVQFSLIIAVDQRLAEASAQGARVAAQGGSDTEIAVASRRVLGNGRLSHAEILARFVDEKGNPLTSGDATEVIVRIEAKKAVPDLLAFIGFSLDGKILVGRTTMRKE